MCKAEQGEKEPWREPGSTWGQSPAESSLLRGGRGDGFPHPSLAALLWLLGQACDAGLGAKPPSLLGGKKEGETQGWQQRWQLFLPQPCSLLWLSQQTCEAGSGAKPLSWLEEKCRGDTGTAAEVTPSLAPWLWWSWQACEVGYGAKPPPHWEGTKSKGDTEMAAQFQLSSPQPCSILQLSQQAYEAGWGAKPLSWLWGKQKGRHWDGSRGDTPALLPNSGCLCRPVRLIQRQNPSLDCGETVEVTPQPCSPSLVVWASL